MILLVVLTALAIAAIVATIVSVARDGYRPVRTDPSRIPDRSPAAPAPIERPAHSPRIRSRRAPQRHARVSARA